MSVLPLIFLLFFVVAGADTLYTGGRRAKILLAIFWSFWLCLFGYALFEIFLPAPFNGINLKDFFAFSFALTLCVVGLISLIFHKKFPNFWLFYPYVCFFIGIAANNAWALFDEAPRNKATYVDDDEIVLWRTYLAFLVTLSIAGLYTLFKHRKLACTLIFVAICLLCVWSFFHFST